MDIGEIKEAIGKDPELRKAVLSEVVATPEGQELIKNSNDTFWKDNIGNEVSKIHSQYDKDIEEILGVKKPDNMKTYDHIKAIAKDFKDLKESGSDSKVKELQDKLKAAQEGGGGQYKELYEQTLAKFNEVKSDYEKSLQEKESELKKVSIINDLKTGMQGLEFDPVYDKEVISQMVSIKQQEFINNAEMDGIKIVYKDADGKIIQGESMGPASAKEIMQKALSPMLKKVAAPGGGADPNTGIASKTGDDGKSTEKLVLDSTRIKSRTEFIAEAERVLKENGIDVRSQKAQEMKDAAAKEYKYAELPRS
jgi:uncharacterized protein YukE